jgi:hypothetical protein
MSQEFDFDVTTRRFKDWSLFLPAVLISGFIAYLSFSEAYKVGVLKNFRDYPFGTGHNQSWDYRSPQNYTMSCLLWGLPTLDILILATISFFQKDRRRQIYSLLGLAGIIILAMLQAALSPGS